MAQVPHLPMPEKLEPKANKRSLMMSVRIYFYSLYNATNSQFKVFLQSVGNADSETLNRLFDRHEAVGMIKEAAEKAKDGSTTAAKDGEIYRCVVNIMRQENLGLKLRRSEYQRLTHQIPAE